MRTLLAAALAAALIAGLLAAWFATGWRGVRAEQAALRAAPRERAERVAGDLADELGSRLETLRASESARPYFHYGNLYHDPRGAHQGESVTPSPLADRNADPLIAAHFQIDASGQVSMPAINEEFPELSNPRDLEDNRSMLASVRAAAPSIELPPADGAAVATAVDKLSAAPPGVKDEKDEKDAPPVKKATKKPVKSGSKGKSIDIPEAQSSTVVNYDWSAYEQNAMPNTVYGRIQEQKPAEQAQAPPRQQQAQPRPVQRSAPPPAQRAQAGGDVEIRMTPLGWRTVALDGAPHLVALRRVDTPDGALMQAFALSPEALDEWLGERRDPELPARFEPGGVEAPGQAQVELEGAPWRIAVDAGPSLAAADRRAAAVARRFLRQFVPGAALAAAAGALLVLLLARSERLARERSSFAAAAAHELRTPLAGLQLYGEMLADGLGNPKRAGDYARRIADEAGRLGRVVGNVLGFTQLERGTLAVHAAPGDAAEAVRAAAERARAGLAHAGSTLEVDVPASLPALLDADAVARILANLLDNAEKYGRGAADRRIRLGARADGDRVIISVRDHGPGVPRATAARLFRPFSRGAPATGADAADRPAGLGLGLAMARTLARGMGGELAHRAPQDGGGGACFELTLRSYTQLTSEAKPDA